MAVTGWNESVASRSVSIAAGEGFQYSRSFTVQVDDPKTKLIDILRAVPVALWDAHPENQYSKAQKFDAKPRGSSLMLYEVTVAYDKVAAKDEGRDGQKPGDPPGTKLPTIVWSGGTRKESQPFKKDSRGRAVANSAGVPFPDAEMETFLPSLSCTIPFQNLGAARAAIESIVGKTNKLPWAGHGASEWLCTDGRWQWKQEDQGGVQFKYVEASLEFALKKPDWGMDLIDLGYQQLVDQDGKPDPAGTKLGPILGGDGKPVKEPVALAFGVAMDPPPTQNNPPQLLRFYPHEDADFGGIVGDPR